MEREDLIKKVDLAFLSAFYGGMLTEKQRYVLSLHCEEDLSLGEISEEIGISRQAVHETLMRAAAKLNEMEEKLGVASRFRRIESGLEEVPENEGLSTYRKDPERLVVIRAGGFEWHLKA